MVKEKDDVVGKKVLIGATGLVLAAGGVAAAVLLSDRKNRVTLGNVAKNSFKKVSTFSETLQKGASDRYENFQHGIDSGKSERGLNSSKPKKSTKINPHAILHQIGIGNSRKSKSGVKMGKRNKKTLKGRGKAWFK